LVVYLQEILDLADWVRGAMILCPHLLDDAAREEIRVVVGPSTFVCVCVCVCLCVCVTQR